jgi:hypothetical protein
MHFVIQFFSTAGIAVPKAQVVDGVVRLRTLQAADCIRKAVFLDAFVKALSLESVRSDSKNGGDRICCKHNSQCASKSIEDQSSTKLSLSWLRPEFGREVLQHMI